MIQCITRETSTCKWLHRGDFWRLTVDFGMRYSQILVSFSDPHFLFTLRFFTSMSLLQNIVPTLFTCWTYSYYNPITQLQHIRWLWTCNELCFCLLNCSLSMNQFQADIILRGYYGWNSRRAIQVMDKIFPKVIFLRSYALNLFLLGIPWLFSSGNFLVVWSFLYLVGTSAVTKFH